MPAAACRRLGPDGLGLGGAAEAVQRVAEVQEDHGVGAVGAGAALVEPAEGLVEAVLLVEDPAHGVEVGGAVGLGGDGPADQPLGLLQPDAAVGPAVADGVVELGVVGRGLQRGDQRGFRLFAPAGVVVGVGEGEGELVAESGGQAGGCEQQRLGVGGVHLAGGLHQEAERRR